MKVETSLDTTQKIYITEESREKLFNHIYEENMNLDYAFSAEYLERVCLGKTYLSDSAYSTIKRLLRKEYKEWLKNNGLTSSEKEINYCDIAGELQTKAMQFSSLQNNKKSDDSHKLFALKYIDDLMYELNKLKKELKN